MKSFVIGSNCSGGGKTTVTIGIMKALKDRGYDIQGYKVGPDYIDSAFHSNVTGKSSRNLDLFLMGEDGMKNSYCRGTGELGIVEGVMGLYDGKGLDMENSTAHIAKELGLPIILVLTPRAQSTTLCAEIKGLVEFGKADVKGIILNNVTEGFYKILKATIEFNCNIKVLGYLPHNNDLVLESRHLGLVQSMEIKDLDKKLGTLKMAIEENIDLDAIVSIAKESTINIDDNYDFHRKNIKIGIAKDEAFSFYYKENLELLEELGQVYYFSPIHNDTLPKDLDFIYFGGGYPEIFKEQLSSNESMRESIRNALEGGVRAYAECGGLMYLTEEIEHYPMVGFFEGKAYMTSSLNNFGYATIEVKEHNDILPKGMKINCHEFHKSLVALKNNTIYNITKENYDGSIKQWQCGYVKKNTLAAYGHVHFFNNIEFFKKLLEV